MDWVSQVVSQLITANGKITAQIDGKPVTVVVAQDFIGFLRDNSILLNRLGKQAFKDFLNFVSSKKIEEAFMMLLAKMQADEIIARMENNAAVLKAHNDNRDSFIAALKKFVVTTLLPQTAKLLMTLI